MAKQAYQFQATVKKLCARGVETTVHGSGLLPTIHREMHRPLAHSDIEGQEARKYCNMWAFDEYRAYSPGESYVDLAVKEMSPEEGGSFIDFGCGTGRPAQKMKSLGYDIIGVDHAVNCLDEDVDIKLVIANLWSLPEIKADYGFCTDVMEHIPTEKIDEALKSISMATDKCFFAIHTNHDAMGSLIGETLHLTVQPKEWWHSKISEYFGSVRSVHDDESAVFVAEV